MMGGRCGIGRKFGTEGFRVEGNLNLFKFGQKREARKSKLLPLWDRNVATEKSCRGLKPTSREVMSQVRALISHQKKTPTEQCLVGH